MNKTMLAQNNLLNQEQSRNDCPFDLPWSSQGVTSLSVERDLHLYAQELVEQYGRFDGECYNVTFDQLSDHDQSTLLAKYFEFNDRDTECVNGNDFSVDNDYSCALLKMLKDNTQENQANFATTVHRNITTYYQKSIQKVLDDACNDYLHNVNNEAGLFACIDRDSGEIDWRKV